VNEIGPGAVQFADLGREVLFKKIDLSGTFQVPLSEFGGSPDVNDEGALLLILVGEKLRGFPGVDMDDRPGLRLAGIRVCRQGGKKGSEEESDDFRARTS
jgi:hypothetical protein